MMHSTAPVVTIEPSNLQPLAVAARRAGVSDRTMRRWIAQGRITGYRVGPRLIRVDPTAVDALVQPIAVTVDDAA